MSGLEQYGFAFLEQGDLKEIADSLKGVSESRKPEYARALNYLLALAERLEKQGLNKDYALIGGYAVFCHIYSVLENNMILSWRGSKDLDIFVKHASIDCIIKTLFEEVDIQKTHFKGKSTFYVKDQLELLRDMYKKVPQTATPVKIDFYIANSEEEIFFDNETLANSLWNRTEEITIFDHKIYYLSLPDLAETKIKN